MEPKSTKEAHSIVASEIMDKDGANTMLEKIMHRDNLNAAYKRVKQNKGSAGIDNMTVDELLPYLKANGQELINKILSEKYKPQPVRKVEIPKPNGGKRQLGIPTVVDRMIQQAIAQILSPIFEEEFSDNSYGFRAGRSAHQAIKRSKEYYEQGYTKVVDIDLEKYFDTVNHEMLINMLREKVKDERVNRLIRKYLKSGIMENGITTIPERGTPQGGNLSPLLSNIYLNKFDQMLETRGHKFVRYADDCNIYVKSQRAAERVMTSCVDYLEKKLKLKVNTTKSRVGSPLRTKFLGFSLYKINGKSGIRPHKTSLKKFKEKVRQITSRKRGASVNKILAELKTYVRGWLGYYAIAEMKRILEDINQWIRRRIRQIHWKHWKRISCKMTNLTKLGIPKGKAWEWANSRLGCWRVAGSAILSRSLTNEHLEAIGYYDISKGYKVLHLKH